MSIRNTTDPLPTLAGPQDSLPNSRLERGEDCALESQRRWSIGQRQMKGSDEEEMGLFWKLPEVKSVHLGKLGPGFGVGAGCGFGFAVGLIGGTGVGPGIPGLQLGFGFGAGCGVGLGFGYGLGRGIGYDGNRRYSNVGNNYQNRGNVPLQDEIGALVDELVVNTKKLIQATSREVDKWRRY